MSQTQQVNTTDKQGGGAASGGSDKSAAQGTSNSTRGSTFLVVAAVFLVRPLRWSKVFPLSPSPLRTPPLPPSRW